MDSECDNRRVLTIEEIAKEFEIHWNGTLVSLFENSCTAFSGVAPGMQRNQEPFESTVLKSALEHRT